MCETIVAEVSPVVVKSRVTCRRLNSDLGIISSVHFICAEQRLMLTTAEYSCRETTCWKWFSLLGIALVVEWNCSSMYGINQLMSFHFGLYRSKRAFFAPKINFLHWPLLDIFIAMWRSLFQLNVFHRWQKSFLFPIFHFYDSTWHFPIPKCDDRVSHNSVISSSASVAHGHCRVGSRLTSNGARSQFWVCAVAKKHFPLSAKISLRVVYVCALI